MMDVIKEWVCFRVLTAGHEALVVLGVSLNQEECPELLLLGDEWRASAALFVWDNFGHRHAPSTFVLDFVIPCY